MKTGKRVQLFLSPVLIAMLAIMLAVVSFGWYQATIGDVNIEATGESVNITVEAPDYTDIKLTFIGDSYKSSKEGEFVITNPGTEEGYFGQTAEYSETSDNNDKPYIRFYKADIVTTFDNISLTDAYIDKLRIISPTTPENYLVDVEGWKDISEEELAEGEEYTKFTVKFYTYNNENDTLTMTYLGDSFAIDEGVKETTIYFGIHFEDPKKPDTFEYDDFRYYGSTYSLGIRFK